MSMLRLAYTMVIAVFVVTGLFSQAHHALAENKEFANAMLDQLNTSDLPSAGQGAENLDPIIARLINVFLSLFGVIFLSIVLYAGYIWMKAQGREEEVERAKKMIQAAMIGIGVVLTAYTISYFAVNQFWQAATAPVTQ